MRSASHPLDGFARQCGRQRCYKEAHSPQATGEDDGMNNGKRKAGSMGGSSAIFPFLGDNIIDPSQFVGSQFIPPWRYRRRPVHSVGRSVSLSIGGVLME